MKRIRALDRRMVALQRQGKIGFWGPSLGQEAVPVATALALEPSDWVFPALRESTVLLVRGFPLVRYLAQAFGSRADVAKGRQMPSHMSAREHNVVSWSSVVATQLPHAVGCAMAVKYRRSPIVCVGFVGEGGTSHPDFHAAMNFAGVFRAPCIIICQNNHWAISTASSRQTASETFAVKASAYGMPGIRVDGNDAVAVHQAVTQARARALDGRGPTFIECVTYRMGAHSTSDDPTLYQPREMLERWAEACPIARLRRHLEESELIDGESDERLEAQIDAEITAAILEAEAEPPPERRTLFEDVYAEPTWNLEEQFAALERSRR